MKKIFVTGPDGLLGSNLVRLLLERGYEVKAMVQPGRDSKTLEGLEIEKVASDLLDAEKVMEASAGADAIIHVAAITSVWPSRGDIYHKVNVEGTRNVAKAALAHKVERFIYVGSASSYGFGPIDNAGTEDSPYQSAKYGLDYIDTKRQAQLEVMEMVEKEGLPGIVVNPTFMIGPYDSKPSSGAMIVAAAKGSIPSYTSGGKNWVAVKDVATGICNALTMGKIGEAYILGGENLSYKDALSRICKTVGKPAPGFQAPSFLVKFAGRMGSLFGSLTGKTPKLSYPMAWIACDGHYFSPEKAIKELNLPQTPLETAVNDAYNWFKENAYLD
ncbi:MAG: NAD-dependent epimerase/dehydratase family protein [Bacteroidia bacterium]|nr:NAD-dependent epimerase/dehydratase family protein [Bacteroidia bacterium]